MCVLFELMQKYVLKNDFKVIMGMEASTMFYDSSNSLLKFLYL